MAAPLLIKKYGNRRLYDTAASKYVTLEQVAEIVRAGAGIRVVDAKTSEDLTQATLVQIILEGRHAARLLPVPLLEQLVRMGDDALAEFFGHYMSFALEAYLQAKRGVQALPWSPFGQVGLDPNGPLARMFLGGVLPWGNGQAAPAPATPPPPVPRDDVAEMRREIDELKKALKRKRR